MPEPTADLAADLGERCAQSLGSWSPPSRTQAELREDYLRHLRERPGGWARSCAGAHLTASALVCVEARREVLLVLHAKIGCWLQTGGHIEADDGSLEAAALREATEETGLFDLELEPSPLLLSTHPVPCGSVRPTFHLDVQYLARSAAGAVPTGSPESTDVRWFAADRLPETDESVLALVRAARHRLGW